VIDISAGKVAHIIVRAREIDAQVGRWDTAADEADAETILEARASDATEAELRAFIDALNSDEKAELVAIMWIGRETFSVEELAEAIQTAKEEATTPTADYLLGVPLLSDYLEEGLSKMGVDPTDEEDEIYLT